VHKHKAESPLPTLLAWGLGIALFMAGIYGVSLLIIALSEGFWLPVIIFGAGLVFVLMLVVAYFKT
jgi:CHASE2 domain-containing sensor protein